MGWSDMMDIWTGDDDSMRNYKKKGETPGVLPGTLEEKLDSKTTKVLFTKDCETVIIHDTCCFSGEHANTTHTFKSGDIYCFAEVDFFAIPQMVKITLLNGNTETTHPDYFCVLPNQIKVLDELKVFKI